MTTTKNSSGIVVAVLMLINPNGTGNHKSINYTMLVMIIVMIILMFIIGKVPVTIRVGKLYCTGNDNNNNNAERVAINYN